MRRPGFIERYPASLSVAGGVFIFAALMLRPVSIWLTVGFGLVCVVLFIWRMLIAFRLGRSRPGVDGSDFLRRQRASALVVAISAVFAAAGLAMGRANSEGKHQIPMWVAVGVPIVLLASAGLILWFSSWIVRRLSRSHSAPSSE